MGGLKPLTKMGNTLLVNKYVLYAVAVLSVVNLMGYMMVGDYGSIVFFILSGILATYFTKNMALTLLVAILLTNIVYRALRSNGMLRRIEGFDTKDDSKKSKESKKESMESKESKESKAPRPATEEEDEVSTERIDNQKTMQDAYKNLDKMLGKDGIKGLSKEANTLMKEQKELMETMESMKPLMDTVFSTVDKFGGMESLMGMASKLGGSPVK